MQHIYRECQLLRGTRRTPQGAGGRNRRGWSNVCIEGLCAVTGQSDCRAADPQVS